MKKYGSYVKKVLKVIAKLAALIIVLGIMVGVTIWSWHKYQERPQITTSLFEVSLGATPLEVKLKLGKPDLELQIDESLESDPEKWGVAYAYNESSYIKSIKKYLRFLDQNGEQELSIICNIDPSYSETLLGVDKGSTEEKLLKRFGEPTHVSIRHDGLAKSLSFEQFKVGYVLEKGVVTSWCVTKSGRLTYNEEYEDL